MSDPVNECPDLACTRRRLLTAAGAAAGLGALELTSPRLAFADSRRRGDLLVVVTLEGGADGLSLVPPLADHGYAVARPDVGVKPGQAIHLDRHFGLHPGLRPLLPYWQDKRLAIVHAVGDSDGTRSHFEATNAMERGVNVSSTIGTGWIDRFMVARGLRSGDFPALSMGRVSGALSGGAPAVSAWDVREIRLQVSPARQRATEAAMRQMYADVAGPTGDAGRRTLQALDKYARFRQDYRPRPGVTYTPDGLGHSLAQVAQVARAGVGLEVACVAMGGWDTHEGMGGAAGGYMHDQVARLGNALAAFAADLGPLMASTTIVTMSEFGRRVAQNGSHGVDHGHGNAMLVLGGGIRGGKVYGRWPGLAPKQLDDGDLRVTTDYRDVLGEVVRRRLGGRSLGSVFPDHRPRELGLARQR
jgi:uncharacterized protein (DUF1501 family)